MSGSLPAIAIRHPIATVMFIASMIAVSLICYRRVPEDERMKFDYRDASCYIPYPGAAPETVEREVTTIVEGELLTMPHVKAIRSRSGEGGCSISVQFDTEADMSDAVAEFRGRIERAKLKLPQEVRRVFIRRHRTIEWSCFRIALFRAENEDELARLARSQIRNRLMRIPGVASVTVSGRPNEEIYVDFDQEALKRYNLPLHAIIPILQSSNINVSVGQVLNSEVRCYVRALDELTNTDQLENLVIGRNLRLKDIAAVRRETASGAGNFTIDGKHGVFIDVRKAAEASLIETCRRVREEIEQIRTEPQFQDVETYVFEDRSARVELAMNTLGNAAKIGGAFSLLIVFLFIRRLRATGLIALNIPLSLLVVFIYLYARDMSFNMITMAGMITVIGLLVDNAIVVMENIHRRNRIEPGAPVQNAITGANEVGVAIAAATLTSIIVFLPVYYLEEGDLQAHMKEFSVPVTVSLLASLFLAMTLMPMGMLLLRDHHDSGWRLKIRGLFRHFSRKAPDVSGKKPGAADPGPVRAYVFALEWVLRNRLSAVFILLLIIGMTALIPYRQVGLRLQTPSADDRIASITVQFEQSVNFDMAKDVFDRLYAIMDERRDELQIKNIFMDYSAMGGTIRAYLKHPPDLAPGEHIRYSTEEIRDIFWRILPENVPGGQLRFGTTQHASRDTQTVSLLALGDDTQVLSDLAERFCELLAAQPDVREAHVEQERREQELRLQVDTSLANQAGITPLAVSRTVDVALRGIQLPFMKGSEYEVPVRGQFSENARTIENVENMLVMGATGKLAALNTISSTSKGTTPRVLERYNGKSVVRMTAEVNSRDLNRFNANLVRLINSFEMPRGYSVDKGYEMTEMDSILRNFSTTLFMAIALIYMIMAALFESCLLPMSVITTIPLSFIGIYWTMYLTGTTMDTISLVGTILMCGIIVNNAIVIVHRIAQLDRGGMPRFDAVVQAGRDRLRPVVMTALTTMAGALPIAIGQAQRKDIMTDVLDSLGRTLVGGMGFGTLLTLLVVPLFYTLIDDARVWLSQYAQGMARILRWRMASDVTHPAG
ncbi:MAG TPA: efflux RND transporter permease subunit [Candidatus Hydrogenedentes bacterium]|nr:efflux RND transporter permease subunit [Candidatus Hydrogenedentota bacterium]HRT19249.1 efflux RND transporter permease subunit [Candidatus Hydrogenedentota bacterium]HRT63329.1 efflux RND transporter permease subunit [Candidatus Hydrogenedentota bacterium]